MSELTQPWDGRPENPERAAYHWIANKDATTPVPLLWTDDGNRPGEFYWDIGDDSLDEDRAAKYWRYVGPALTPAEHAAALAAAWIEGRDAGREAAFDEDNIGCGGAPTAALIERAIAALTPPDHLASALDRVTQPLRERAELAEDRAAAAEQGEGELLQACADLDLRIAEEKARADRAEAALREARAAAKALCDAFPESDEDNSAESIWGRYGAALASAVRAARALLADDAREPVQEETQHGG